MRYRGASRAEQSNLLFFSTWAWWRAWRWRGGAEASNVHGPLLSDRFAKAFCILHAVPKNYAIAAGRFLLPLHIVRIFSYRLLPLPLPLPQPQPLLFASPLLHCGVAIVFWSLFASSYTKIGFAVGLHLRNCERWAEVGQATEADIEHTYIHRYSLCICVCMVCRNWLGQHSLISLMSILAAKTSWRLSNFVVELSAIMSDGSKAAIQFIYKNI